MSEIRFNNGVGALLCDGCRVIIAYGFDHDTTKDNYCEECELQAMLLKAIEEERKKEEKDA